MRRVAKILCLVLGLVAMLYVLAGCETWSGVGKDIQKGGQAIEKSAD